MQSVANWQNLLVDYSLIWLMFDAIWINEEIDLYQKILFMLTWLNNQNGLGENRKERKYE